MSIDMRGIGVRVAMRLIAVDIAMIEVLCGHRIDVRIVDDDVLM